MENHFVRIEVLWADEDLVDLGVTVAYGDWSAFVSCYASPSQFAGQAGRLRRWVSAPTGRVRMNLVENTEWNSMSLEFYTVDPAGHARCAVELLRHPADMSSRHQETWRMVIALETELGLIEQFARDCGSICATSEGEALLPCTV